jgi:dTDP-4-amino-4,6-dideoxygalactose transaminase
MTTGGEGGAITTQDEELWRTCWEFKDHGKSWRAVFEQTHPPGFRWLHDSFGSNARMTEIQAAVGRSQLRKLDKWVASRQANAQLLNDGLSDMPLLHLPQVPRNVRHAYYRFYSIVREERLAAGWDRDLIVAAIVAEGIPSTHGGCSEIYRERAFDTVGRPAKPLPVAEELGRSSFTLPVHPTLTADDMTDVIAAVRKVCEAATR